MWYSLQIKFLSPATHGETPAVWEVGHPAGMHARWVVSFWQEGIDSSSHPDCPRQTLFLLGLLSVALLLLLHVAAAAAATVALGVAVAASAVAAGPWPLVLRQYFCLSTHATFLRPGRRRPHGRYPEQGLEIPGCWSTFVGRSPTARGSWSGCR